jgi:hypothetical protein
MKKIIVITVFLVLVTSLAGVASAKMIKTPFSGVGVPAGAELPFNCTYPDGNEHCRDAVLFSINDMGPLSGYETIIFNWNFRKDGSGPWWGTSTTVNDAQVVIWETNCTGERLSEAEDFYGYLKCVAHGHGPFEGKKAFFHGIRPGDQFVPFEFAGYILEKD